MFGRTRLQWPWSVDANDYVRSFYKGVGDSPSSKKGSLAGFRRLPLTRCADLVSPLPARNRAGDLLNEKRAQPDWTRLPLGLARASLEDQVAFQAKLHQINFR